jgi:two-component system, cell cycle response regulator DivK
VPTALIVDDNEKNLKLARDVLREAGFRTLDARSGSSGISLALAHVPDVVLLDLRLPDLDGTDVVRRLRADIRSARIPVVAMSATPLDPEDDWFLAAGFDGYLAKPIDVDALPEQVLRFCAPGTV